MSLFNCCKPIITPERRKEVALAERDVCCSTAPPIDAEMMRSKSESRILKAATVSSSDRRSSASSNARSLFEASAYRVAAHSTSSNGEDMVPDEDNAGIPDKFLEEYIAALRDSNGKWATETDVADLFTSNAKMITQDKKTHEGKSNVLKRLDQGVETLTKMAGKDAVVPEWEIKGPVLTEAMAHQYKCTIKRGVMKFSFSLEFTIIGGKIAQLKNSRL
ncbi:hypothetical protein Ndes2526B_g02975 [Nannochloris sp. 'desiccata']|nr:hypothetical protein KSW81_006776 [Chlorella desiccata (nom. nud.)]